MLKSDLTGYMEFKCYMPNSELNVPLSDLVRFADLSQVHSFGWPIAPVIHDDRFKPVPFENGIRCLIEQNGMFDFWTLKPDGKFYILKSLFEDIRGGGKIFFDTRIIRTMEVLWRTARLYKQMGANDDVIIECEIEYGGLANRKLMAANPNRIMVVTRVCHDNVFAQQISSTVGNLLTVDGLSNEVHNFCQNFFQHFEFFELRREHTDQIVQAYFSGRTS